MIWPIFLNFPPYKNLKNVNIYSIKMKAKNNWHQKQRHKALQNVPKPY